MENPHKKPLVPVDKLNLDTPDVLDSIAYYAYEGGKAEQAEIVTELVTALSFYLVDWSMDGTIHQATIDFATAAQEKARKAIAKTKGE